MATLEDCLCDYSDHKRRLSDILFPVNTKSIIPRNSQAYKEFWNFLQRFQRVIHKKCSESNNLSTVFEKRKRLNISTVNYRLEDYMRHNAAERSSRRLSSANIQCLHMIFDMYFDFLQKQKISKIVKLRRDQAALPISTYRIPMLQLLKEHRVIVVAGDTGCGKSTQVPQYLYHGMPSADGQYNGTGYSHIAVTQPRRIACISLATRVSTEMLAERMSTVAYQVRFERSRTKATRILFLTEGLLLRQMQLDPFLKDYDVLVLDEVHERHWQTDCLLGLVKCLVSARPELRVVLMSATINVKLFSSFFGDCPILEVPGRLFPIDVKYVPPTAGESHEAGDRLDPSPYLRLMQRIDARYPSTERGDLLIFLPGMAEIQAVMEPAKAYAEQTKRWIVLPLHSTLSAEDQEKVFHITPDGVRKCVLSTNIAETSLTIDGIRFVADSGRVKELSWDASARMRRLKEFPISKASADQRKGRAGRTGPGVCFRLFSQEDYNAFERFSTPEIRRVPLETLVLQMLVMGLPDIARFPFVEAPEAKSLEEAVERLKSHGALAYIKDPNDQSKKPPHLIVTPLGRLLADLPVDFSLGRMLIMASLLGFVEPVLSLTAGLAVQCPLLPITALSGAEQARRVEQLAEYESDHGDAFTVMNVFDEWLQIKSEASGRPDTSPSSYDEHQSSNDRKTNTRRWCRRIGAQEQRLHEMVRLRTQFAQLLRDAGLWTGGRIRTREMKQRRDLNRARRTERMQTKRRRLLTLQDNELVDDNDSGKEEEGDGETSDLRKWLATAGTGRHVGSLDVSVRDLELVLCYDLSTLANYATRHGTMTQADLTLLKIILAGGLYPHVAIADPANAYRVANRGGAAGPGAEMVFHTRAKGFVTIHPNDVFVRNPDVLFPDPKLRASLKSDEDSEDVESQRSSELPSGFAVDHQLLMYLDLLETTKPFLVNTLRVPALPTLLLYARELDTSANAVRIVFDSWIEVCMADVEAAQRALATAVWLRTLLDQLMELQLAECARKRDQQAAKDSGEVGMAGTSRDSSEELHSESARRCRRIRSVLGEGLAAFLASHAGGPYTIRRLLAGDVKRLFRVQPITQPGPTKKFMDDFPEESWLPLPPPDSGVQMNEKKGGYTVTPYLTIDSLYSEGPVKHPHLSATYEESYGESLELACRLVNQYSKAQQSLADTSNEEIDKNTEEDADGPHCSKCGQRLSNNTSYQTALLRHQKSCTGTQ